jgi:signal transduction histidine kinase
MILTGAAIGGEHMGIRRAVLIATSAVLPFQPGLSQSRPRDIDQYTHMRWSEESDPPVPVFALTQDNRGFLWVGAGLGLYRFDGLSFHAIDLPAGISGSALAIHAARNGDIWVSFAGSLGYHVYRGGRLLPVKSPKKFEGIVIKFAEEADGAIWAGMGEYGKGLLRYRTGQWTHFSEKDGLPADELLGLEVAHDGAVWASYGNSVVRMPRGGRRFATFLPTPGGRSRIDQDRAGRMWLSDTLGIRPITGPGGTGVPPPLRFAYRLPPAFTQADIRFDSRDNLWIAMNRDGLRHIAQPDPAGEASAAEASAAVAVFRTTDGLTSNNARQAFEDREGNIWIPTETGLDKFRPSSFWVDKRLVSTATYNDVLLAASTGDVFIGQRDAIYRVVPGGDPEQILRNKAEPQAMCEKPDLSLWIVYPDRIIVWREGRVERSFAAPATETGFDDCGFDAEGRLLLSASGSGLFRLEGGRIRAIPSGTRGEKIAPSLILNAAPGRTAVVWNPQAVGWLGASGAPRSVTRVGGAEDSIRTAFAKGDRLIVTGSFGLARVAGDRIQTIASDRFEAASKIRGIVEAPDGYSWLVSQIDLFRIRTADLDRAFADPDFAPVVLKLNEKDGRPGRIGVQSARPMVRGGDGRMWMTTAEGIAWVDPAHLVRNPVAPKAAILSVAVGTKTYADPRKLSLPAGTSDLKIDFSILSLANPKQNRARYRLIGHDIEWIDPGNRREAFYTNLAPGSYRFLVTGANSDGTWTEKGASVDIEIAPAFRQTPWFFALCGGALLLLLFGLHRARLAQVAATVRKRLEERLSERERIARELHDTLFQSVQGLVLHVQAVVNRMTLGNPDRARLSAALADADKVIAEGRDILSDLRDKDGSTDLQAAIAAILLDRGHAGTPVKIYFEGATRPVDPMVAAEIARVVREAVANARLHSGAQAIEVRADFGIDMLKVTIGDDGRGWPDEVLASGNKPGRYGLVGMRERAARIGGSLALRSSERGALVEMIIPGRIAYEDRRSEAGRAETV